MRPRGAGSGYLLECYGGPLDGDMIEPDGRPPARLLSHPRTGKAFEDGRYLLDPRPAVGAHGKDSLHYRWRPYP